MNTTDNTGKKPRKPMILVPTGARDRDGLDYQVMGTKYLVPLATLSECDVLMVPTCFGSDAIDAYLDLVDGVFLSGASTNIDPTLYGQTNLTPEKSQDIGRDNFNIALIPKALEKGLPFFGVCRGLQEFNIAYGGDLYQALYKTEGMMDHREKDPEAPLSEQYGPNHSVKLIPNTWLADALGENEFMVNSLHGQGIKTLGTGLTALAHAEDGLIEAATHTAHEQFNLGVQWHPEWMSADNPIYTKLFQEFGKAARVFAAKRG
ncbi:MAG: gamma-glutamyl-gamma-aminobutyrate hydrolase family protein [Formosimonas sp.]